MCLFCMLSRGKGGTGRGTGLPGLEIRHLIAGLEHVPTFMLLFRRSYEHAVMPDVWAAASTVRIIPMFKEGAASEAANSVSSSKDKLKTAEIAQYRPQL